MVDWALKPSSFLFVCPFYSSALRDAVRRILDKIRCLCNVFLLVPFEQTLTVTTDNK